MFTIHPVGGHPGGECYLAVTEKSTLLFDAGFDFAGERTAENIRAALGDRPLDYILASHSHYDHITGIPKIRRRFPALRVVASPLTAKVFANPKARELMRSLNAGCARDAGIDAEEDHIDELSVDVELADGEELRLPDLTVRAVATPGHTRCSMAYFIPEAGFLASSETLGIAPAYPDVVPCMIIGARVAIESIERCRELKPERVLVSHSLVVDEPERFFDKARAAVEEAVGVLLAMHRDGENEDAIVAEFVRRYYLPSAAIQPERAFVLNTRALIPRILEELGE